MSVRVIVACLIGLVAACSGPQIAVGPPDVPGAGGQVSMVFEEDTAGSGDRVADAAGFPVPVCPVEADAGVAVTTLCQGKPAPFSGTLISPAAVARLMAEIEACPSKCDEAARHAKQQCEDDCALKEKLLKAELKSEREKRQAQVLSRDKQIDALTKQLAAERDQPLWLYVGGGVLGGGLLTGLAAYLVTR